jgi:putative transposase
MGVTGMTVGIWRKRYREFGIEVLHDELRPGRPRTYDDVKVAEVINRAPHTFAKPSPEARSIAGSRHSAFNPIAKRHSQSRQIPSVSRRVRDILGLYCPCATGVSVLR